MISLVSASIGLVLAGPFGALLGGVAPLFGSRLSSSRTSARETRVILVLLLVELRSGSSVLAALQRAAVALPAHPDLRRLSRVATVSGLTASIDCAGELRPLVVHLARAQRSGASLSTVVRHLLEQDLAADRAARLARARSLPVRLMVPVALLMLPGLVLLLYAPSLLSTLEGLTGALP